MLRGLLDSEQINYFVHNDHFGSLRTGPNIPLFNEKSVMVEAGQYKKARELLAGIETGGQKDAPEVRGGRLWYSLRVILETLLFGWFIPRGSRR